METAMRAQRQKVRLLQKGEADKDVILNERIKYNGQLYEYTKFSNKMNLKMQKQRIYQDGLGAVGIRGKTPPLRKSYKNKHSSGIIRVERTSLTAEPNSTTEVVNKKGGIDRNYYDSAGKQYKQISNNDHGNPKQHPYGKNGEHAHDYIYGDDGKLKSRPARELTEAERKENEDIL